MSGECVIVDANIAFRSLLAGRGDLRERIGLGGHPRLFTPRFLLVELLSVLWMTVWVPISECSEINLVSNGLLILTPQSRVSKG